MSESIREYEREAARATLPVDFAFALAQGFATRLGVLARHAGANPSSVRWLERAAFAVSRATSDGHVCVTLDALLKEQDEWLDSPRQARSRLRAALLGSGMVCDGQAASAELTPLVLDQNNRIYLARYYDYERQLANSLVQRAQISVGDGVAGSVREDASALAVQLEAFFGAPEADQVDWQRVAAALALSGRLTVISGGPGTGKTTTVVAILACLLAQAARDRQPLRIALAAPTGKAAQRMQEALLERAGSLPPELAAHLPRHSYTLHRLLGVGPGGRFRHHRDAPLPYDVIVIDEASMIDVALAARLVDAVPPASRLIMLGDKDQLSAVEAGAVFAELSARPALSPKRLDSLAQALALTPAQLAAALPDASPSAMSNGLPGALPRAAPNSLPGALPNAAPNGLPGTVPGAGLQDAEPKGGATAAAPLIDCVVWLERNYRFGLASPIGRLSLAIKDGAAGDALAVLSGHPDSAVLYEDGGRDLNAASLETLAAGYQPYAEALRQALAAAHHLTGQRLPDPGPLFDAFNRYRVLCAVRAGARGVDALNSVLAGQVRHEVMLGAPLEGELGGVRGSNGGPAGQAVGIGGAVPHDAAWYAGRPVMVTRNDYALGLFNGDIGIAMPAGQTLRVVFRKADGSYRAVSPAALPPHDTAFAMTVHKSQGSEFIHAALVLPATASRVLTRELVYTAVTRAREKIALYSAIEVLAQAIVSRTERDSGMAARLAEAAQALREEV